MSMYQGVTNYILHSHFKSEAINEISFPVFTDKLMRLVLPVTKRMNFQVLPVNLLSWLVNIQVIDLKHHQWNPLTFLDQVHLYCLIKS